VAPAGADHGTCPYVVGQIVARASMRLISPFWMYNSDAVGKMLLVSRQKYLIHIIVHLDGIAALSIADNRELRGVGL
jgi:hypothetical protein